MAHANQATLAGPGPAIEPTAVVAVLGAWADGPGPLHERLAASLRAGIDRGDLAPGTTLPTERALAEAVAVSRATVGAAYAELKRTGRLRARQGSGTWVAPIAVGAEPSRVGPLLRGPDGAIDLSLAAPLAGPEVATALADVATRPAAALAGFGYLPTGVPALREAVTGLLDAEGPTTDPSQVLLTAGAQQALHLLAAE